MLGSVSVTKLRGILDTTTKERENVFGLSSLAAQVLTKLKGHHKTCEGGQ